MKIAFITDSEQELYFFPGLIEALGAEIKDLEARELFVPSALDIPAKCLDALDCELIFVQHFFEKEDLKVQTLMAKLVDFELSNKVKVVKAIESFDLEELLTEEDFENAKAELAQEWSQGILGVLFNQEAFKPSPSEESEDGEESEAEESGEDEGEEEPESEE